MKRLLLITVIALMMGCNYFNRVGVTNPQQRILPPPQVVIVEAQTKTLPTAAFNDTPVPTQIPTSTPLPSPTAIAMDFIYIVHEGDSLDKIAGEYKMTADSLAVANDIKDKNLIFVGQILTIPNPEIIPTPTITDKQIVVDVGLQKVFAFNNGQLVQQFTVSTGLPATPTIVKGVEEFKIYLKLELARMKGDGYDLANVPWAMYFYKDYGLHGTYWHSNFGTPMSHGCVNLKTEDAKWLYDWAPIGTAVLVVR